MIFGDQSDFAVECEFTSQEGSWVYGSFRLWVGGNAIGTYSEEVIDLAATTGVLRKPVEVAPTHAEKLQASEFFCRVFEAHHGNGGFKKDDRREWGCFLWLAHCEGFETVFSAIARVGSEVRIVWRLSEEEMVNEHYSSGAKYSSVCAAFISWLDHGIADRRRSV